jgi:hypothetical protein
MRADEAAAAVSYTIPARMFSGEPEHVVAQIDDLIQTLLAVRQAVEGRQSRSAQTAWGRWRVRVGLLLPGRQAGASANR